MFRGTGNIYKIFFTFNMNVKNIYEDIVGPT